MTRQNQIRIGICCKGWCVDRWNGLNRGCPCLAEDIRLGSYEDHYTQWTTWRRVFQLTVWETHFSIIRRWLGISCEIVAAEFHIIPFKLVPIYHLSIARIRMKERTTETRTDLLCSTNTCRLIVLTIDRWNGRSDGSASGWSNNSTPETQHVHVRNSTSISYLVINEQQKPWSRYLRTVPNPTTW